MAGDVVTVKHGFARNALLPSRIGVTQPKSAGTGSASLPPTVHGLSAVLTQLTSSPPVELSSRRAAKEDGGVQTFSAADVVLAVLEQKKIVLAQEFLIMSQAGTLAEGSHKIPLRFSVPGFTERPMLPLLIKRGEEV